MVLDWLLYGKAKHIVRKGECCDIVMGELSQSLVWHQGDFTIDTRWNLMNYTMSLPSIISNEFQSYIMEDIDSYKEASCMTSSKALTKVMWLPLL
jgi:hypothetical protein